MRICKYMRFISQSLEKLVDDLRPGVQELKEGKYHDVEKVEKRVESLASKLCLLGPRLKEASSAVDEAQAVVAMETSLEELEVWLVSCGKFSYNQNIVSQIEEHKVHVCVYYMYTSRLTMLLHVKWFCASLASYMYRDPCPPLQTIILKIKWRWGDRGS